MSESVLLLHADCINRWLSKERQQAMKIALRAVIDRGTTMLTNEIAAVDIVVKIVQMLKNCEFFNASKEAALTMKKNHELKADVVDGAFDKYDAVAVARTIKNSIRAAFHLLAHEPHKLLVGSAADEIALQNELNTIANDYFITPERRRHLNECDLRIVGAIVLDHQSFLAAAGSTGGTARKSRERVGDTIIIDVDLFANFDIVVV
ncbi:MAG: hypothetical protein Q9195_008328 [Heterodermia aff. obscurata]